MTSSLNIEFDILLSYIYPSFQQAMTVAATLFIWPSTIPTLICKLFLPNSIEYFLTLILLFNLK